MMNLTMLLLEYEPYVPNLLESIRDLKIDFEYHYKYVYDDIVSFIIYIDHRLVYAYTSPSHRRMGYASKLIKDIDRRLSAVSNYNQSLFLKKCKIRVRPRLRRLITVDYKVVSEYELTKKRFYEFNNTTTISQRDTFILKCYWDEGFSDYDYSDIDATNKYIHDELVSKLVYNISVKLCDESVADKWEAYYHNFMRLYCKFRHDLYKDQTTREVYDKWYNNYERKDLLYHKDDKLFSFRLIGGDINYTKKII